jgi:rare lipoprotein A (peptidoglycan hydrolase)
VFSAKKSNYLFKPGKYAKRSIPARSTSSRLRAKERRVLNKIGNKYGCHSCGVKSPGIKSKNWIADYQPVTRLKRKGQKQRLYPHCSSCSSKQGGYASQYGKRKKRR